MNDKEIIINGYWFEIAKQIASINEIIPEETPAKDLKKIIVKVLEYLDKIIKLEEK